MLFSWAINQATQFALALQSSFGLGGVPSRSSSVFPTLAFAETWEILGPFQVGTREATWGADPLESFGGFRALSYSANATYRTSIGVKGTVRWSHLTARTSEDVVNNFATAELTVGFPHIESRPFLQDIYGWAALQYQTWARGHFEVYGDTVQTALLHAEHILEFWINDEHYFGGDLYAFGRAPLVLHLKPGKHQVDVRLIRDVRSMGAVGKPEIDVKLELRASRGQEVGLQFGSLVLISDVVGPLAGSYASVIVRNDGLKDITINELGAPPRSCEVRLHSKVPIVVVPGQSRPIAFQLACVEPYFAQLPLSVKYTIQDESQARSLQTIAELNARANVYSPHKVTFMHPGGIVSYAVLRPPSKEVSCGEGSLPVLLQLHGAGVEADSDQQKSALDSVPNLCAWVLFPSGVTPWSGDDWHVWGLADVEAAIAAVPAWIEQVGWKGPGVDIDKWLVTGHSNGGQGTWYTLTHKMDKIIAAAPVSAPSSIQNYVPYLFWQPADPGRTALVQIALNNYRHELLLDNTKGIPNLIQHGDADDNVPVYNSRLMYQLLQQAGVASAYAELPGKNHWFDGVMTTEPLRKFYDAVLDDPSVVTQLGNFSLVTANPGDTGSKAGLQILQLETPGQLGRIEVTSNESGYSLHTSNVLGFRLPKYMYKSHITLVDGEGVVLNVTNETTIVQRVPFGVWHNETSFEGFKRPSRTGRQLGFLDAILKTNGSFYIVPHTKGAAEIALQISRNLCQYFSADTNITTHYSSAKDGSGNVISVAIGLDLPEASNQHPIRALTADSLTVKDISGFAKRYTAENGLAAIFLRPLNDERLELVVWAADEESLPIAARLVPMLTGVGAPDFVIADRSMLWKGVEGTLAMGLFNSYWEVSRNSYLS